MGVRPSRSDLAVSAGLILVGLTEVLLVREAGASTADPSGEVCAIALTAGCLAFRRSLPTISAVLVFTGLAIVSVAGADSRAWEVAALMTATYSCARHASWAGAWTVLWAAVLYGILIMRLEGGTGFWQGLGNITFYLALMVLSPWVAGLSLRRRQQASQHDADRAVEQERVRIARELHDVVGHALGLIVVQAEGERALCFRFIPLRSIRSSVFLGLPGCHRPRDDPSASHGY